MRVAGEVAIRIAPTHAATEAWRSAIVHGLDAAPLHTWSLLPCAEKTYSGGLCRSAGSRECAASTLSHADPVTFPGKRSGGTFP
jgi:hypothetical protein